jgi:hypothetical protein
VEKDILEGIHSRGEKDFVLGGRTLSLGPGERFVFGIYTLDRGC